MTNYAAHHPGCNGWSVAFDAKGDTLVQAHGNEDIYLASFGVEKQREYRKATIWGGAFRRPHRYGDLVKTDKLPVFERGNAFGEEFEAEKR